MIEGRVKEVVMKVVRMRRKAEMRCMLWAQRGGMLLKV